MDDNKPIVFIKELSERDRPYMLNHFLALSAEDRQLRFGAMLADEAVTKYVNNIDFTRDKIFGVYESTYNMVGVGHLAFAPPETLPAITDSPKVERVAEFGVSVAAPVRRMCVGTKLFDRAAIHCRNNGVDTLYIHCLASNRPMLCIAKKAGMEIHRDHGEVDGYLKLPDPNSATLLHEAVEERAASVDYALNQKFQRVVHWVRNRLNPKNL
jgi:GNAT superfamily N-acetyltransferase